MREMVAAYRVEPGNGHLAGENHGTPRMLL
jgi:hypothetical protein